MSKLILLVDDDHDLVSVVKDILEISGYLVATASNGSEALSYLRSCTLPSVIFLDLTMPVMNGVRFLEEMQSGANADFDHIPVVIMSAVTDFLCLKRFEIGSILVKPVSMEKLLEAAAQFTTEASPGRIA